MALGIVGAYGGLTKKEIPDCLFVGELSLDGGVRGVRGALPIAIEARGRKISRMVVPEANAKEASMVGGVDVYPVRSLLDVISFVNSGNGIAPIKADGDSLLRESQQFFVDFKDVRGQQTAKRAIEIACAGGHNILMIGPPDRHGPPPRLSFQSELFQWDTTSPYDIFETSRPILTEPVRSQKYSGTLENTECFNLAQPITEPIADAFSTHDWQSRLERHSHRRAKSTTKGWPITFEGVTMFDLRQPGL